MKKEELVKQLEAAKALSSQVDIDKVVELIKQLETPTFTQELADEIANKIELCLDNNSDGLVDLDSAEFELNYDNRIELNRVDVCVSEIMEHIVAVMDDFVNEVEDLQVEAYNENFGTFLSRLENESGLDQ
jgi:predicted restriction endonuclease